MQIASGQLTERGTTFINLIPRLESAESHIDKPGVLYEGIQSEYAIVTQII